MESLDIFALMFYYLDCLVILKTSSASIGFDFERFKIISLKLPGKANLKKKLSAWPDDWYQ